MRKTTKEIKEEFIKVVRLNGIKPIIDPEDGKFDDHLSMTLWNFIETVLDEQKKKIEEVEHRMNIEKHRSDKTKDKYITGKYIGLRYAVQILKKTK